MISTYFLSKERGRATAIQSTVNTLGPALAVVVAASIIGAFGWHMVFIVLGIPGLFIAAGIYLFTRGNPKDHPAITQQDLAELAADDQGSLQNTSAIAFKDVLKMPVLWQMASIWFLFDITFWGFSTWLPSYLITVREFSGKDRCHGGHSLPVRGWRNIIRWLLLRQIQKPQRKTLYVVTSVIAGFPVSDLQREQCRYGGGLSVYFSLVHVFRYGNVLGIPDGYHSQQHHGAGIRYC